jgi:hypothetical protein
VQVAKRSDGVALLPTSRISAEEKVLHCTYAETYLERSVHGGQSLEVLDGEVGVSAKLNLSARLLDLVADANLPFGILCEFPDPPR